MLFNNYGDENLVILCAGDNAAHLFFEDENERKYELLVIYYGDNEEQFKDKFKTFDHFISIKGYKFNIIKKYYNENIKFFKNYKNILIPDDDIYLKTKDINNFFKIFNDKQLMLAQPSLIGYFSHAITLHRFEYFLRYTNFVEIMMPCFSADALTKCINSFDETSIGWGLDYLWPKILKYPNEKIAIIDEIIAIHSREVGSSNLYINNKENEFLKFMEKNCLNKAMKNVIGSISKENFNTQPLAENFYPHSEIFKFLIENYKGN
jgi:hypothetical protein